MSGYTAEDLARVEAFREQLRVELKRELPPAFLNADVAQLIADARDRERARCAGHVEAGQPVDWDALRKIRSGEP